VIAASDPRIRLIKHEAVPGCGSFEVRFADGRSSQYFYFEDLPGRRLRLPRASYAAIACFAGSNGIF
jgi:hypothetical protein